MAEIGLAIIVKGELIIFTIVGGRKVMPITTGRAASLGVIAAMLAGCQTTSLFTSTAVVQDAQASSDARSYLTYHLPVTMISVTLTAKGGGGGDAKTASSATATATSSTTITIDGKTASASSPDGKAGKADAAPAKPNLRSACDQAEEEYNVLQAAHADYMLARVSDVEALRAVAAKPLASAAARKTTDDLVKAFRDKAALDDERVVAAGPLARRVAQSCTFPVQVALTLEVAPDTGQAYRLRVKDDSGSADNFTAKLDANGLLTSVSSTTDDKSGEVASAAVKSIGTALGVSSAGFSGFSIMGLPKAVAAAPDNHFAEFFLIPGLGPKPKPKVVDEATYRANLLALIATFDNHPPTPLPLLAAPDLPDYPLKFALQDKASWDSKPVDVPIGDTVYVMRLACSSLPQAPKTNPSLDSADGVIVSSPRACVAKIAASGYVIDASGKLAPATGGPTAAAFDTAQTFSFAALDSRQPLSAALLRTSLIKRANDYEFKDGQLTQVTYDKPSDALAAWALPGTIIGDFFGGFVAGVQGPGGVYKAQADVLSQKAAVYKAHADEIDAQAKLKAASAPAAAAATPAATKTSATPSS